jgi:hypothetical protein
VYAEVRNIPEHTVKPDLRDIFLSGQDAQHVVGALLG